jgi:hypothetical protein
VSEGTGPSAGSPTEDLARALAREVWWAFGDQRAGILSPSDLDRPAALIRAALASVEKERDAAREAASFHWHRVMELEDDLQEARTALGEGAPPAAPPESPAADLVTVFGISAVEDAAEYWPSWTPDELVAWNRLRDVARLHKFPLPAPPAPAPTEAPSAVPRLWNPCMTCGKPQTRGRKADCVDCWTAAGNADPPQPEPSWEALVRGAQHVVAVKWAGRKDPPEKLAELVLRIAEFARDEIRKHAPSPADPPQPEPADDTAFQVAWRIVDALRTADFAVGRSERQTIEAILEPIIRKHAPSPADPRADVDAEKLKDVELERLIVEVSPRLRIADHAGYTVENYNAILRDFASRLFAAPAMSRARVVYLVMEHHDYEGSDVVSVHETSKGAEKHAARLRELMDKARQRRQAWLDSDEEVEPPWPKDVPDCDSISVSGEWPVRS